MVNSSLLSIIPVYSSLISSRSFVNSLILSVNFFFSSFRISCFSFISFSLNLISSTFFSRSLFHPAISCSCLSRLSISSLMVLTCFSSWDIFSSCDECSLSISSNSDDRLFFVFINSSKSSLSFFFLSENSFMIWVIFSFSLVNTSCFSFISFSLNLISSIFFSRSLFHPAISCSCLSKLCISPLMALIWYSRLDICSSCESVLFFMLSIVCPSSVRRSTSPFILSSRFFLVSTVLLSLSPISFFLVWRLVFLLLISKIFDLRFFMSSNPFCFCSRISCSFLFKLSNSLFTLSFFFPRLESSSSVFFFLFLRFCISDSSLDSSLSA